MDQARKIILATVEGSKKLIHHKDDNKMVSVDPEAHIIFNESKSLKERESTAKDKLISYLIALCAYIKSRSKSGGTITAHAYKKSSAYTKSHYGRGAY